MFGIILQKAKPIQLRHIFIDLEKRFLKNLAITILLKIMIKDIIFEKKTRNFIAKDLFTLKYKKRVVKPKKGKGSYKRKKIKLV